MMYFKTEAHAERCGEYWLEKIKETILGNGTAGWKARRIKILAYRAHACFTWKLSELDHHARDMDPEF